MSTPTFLPLTSEAAFDALLAQSNSEPVLVLKHSKRCSISNMAKTRLSRNYPEGLPANVHLVDVIDSRAVSNHIAKALHEPHESPQLFLLQNGQATLVQNHMDVDAREVADQIGLVA